MRLFVIYSICFCNQIEYATEFCLHSPKFFTQFIFKHKLTTTVWRQKKPPKVNECSSVANYCTAMIFFLQSSQYSYVFFDGNCFCSEFVCLLFFALFRVSRVQKGPKNTLRYPGFSSNNNKKNPGCRDLQGKFFGRYAPDQNIDLRPNGGGADGVLGGGSLL